MNTHIELVLSPVMYENCIPEIRVHINDKNIYTGLLTKTESIIFKKDLAEQEYNIIVTFLNKEPGDTIVDKGLDKAVLIDKLKINDVDCSDLLYKSKYYSGERGLINSATYLGWNGSWVMQFSVPAFIWIHKEKSMGWVYP